MSRFQLKITHHAKNQADFKLNGKIQSIDVNTKMPELLELSYNDFKVVILKMFCDQLLTCPKQMKSEKRRFKQGNKIHKEEYLCLQSPGRRGKSLRLKWINF